ncbi:hypothetical protein H920_15004 [Fukomys damarensis]|uniref:Uncharacterized protein n=1 Tax=Fukomys damarensis TaxID=885580 RepID=A0A091D0V1_FUKDA|nr:hypothetical protein H920_15004 [Fukomys damarensis]
MGVDAGKGLLVGCNISTSQSTVPVLHGGLMETQEAPGSQENSLTEQNNFHSRAPGCAQEGAREGGIFQEPLCPQPPLDVTGHTARWSLAAEDTGGEVRLLPGAPAPLEEVSPELDSSGDHVGVGTCPADEGTGGFWTEEPTQHKGATEAQRRRKCGPAGSTPTRTPRGSLGVGSHGGDLTCT